MGYYVNPPSGDKVGWLNKHGEQLAGPGSAKITETHLPVCLVFNFHFMAAAVCYSEAELKEFAQPDGRRKLWYSVPRTALKEVGAYG